MYTIYPIEPAGSIILAYIVITGLMVLLIAVLDRFKFKFKNLALISISAVTIWGLFYVDQLGIFSPDNTPVVAELVEEVKDGDSVFLVYSVPEGQVRIKKVPGLVYPNPAILYYN